MDMSHFQTFSNEALGATVRVDRTRDGKMWMVARDLSTFLGYKNQTVLLKRIHECDVMKVPYATVNPNRKWQRSLTLISEQGMYGILMRSRKPKAAAFRDWLADEVLPQLRAECAPKEVENDILNPDVLIKLATELKERRAADAETANTIFVAKARATRLEHLMGLGGGVNGDWFRVASIPWLEQYFRLVQPMYEAVEDTLDTVSKSIGIDVASVPIGPYQTKRVFNKKAVRLLKKMLDDDPKLLKRFRNYGNKTSK